MRTNAVNRIWGELGLAVAGPASFGVLMATPYGALSALRLALVLPCVVLGVVALMTPALYVGLNLTGSAPRAASLARALLSALAGMGLALLGLAPAVLFMVQTLGDPVLGLLLSSLMLLAMGTLAGRRLFESLGDDLSARLRAVPVLLLWMPMTLGLALTFYISSLKPIF